MKSAPPLVCRVPRRSPSSPSSPSSLRGPAAAAVLAAALGAAGCASLPVAAPAGAAAPAWLEQARASYAPPSQPLPAPEALFGFSESMKAFADREFAALNPLRDRREALLDALFRGDAGRRLGLKLQYDASRTRSAAEAFEARAGNCLSLVLMTAAFAEHLGLAVHFQEVRTEPQYTRHGTLTMASGHVNLVLGVRPSGAAMAFRDNRVLVVDFLPPDDTRGQRTTALQRHTVVAMYFNNRAGELLAAGHNDDAYWHAREALRHDPDFLHAANTLGVIHERHGQPAAAEAAYRHVLASRPDTLAALGNLARLLRLQGRDDEAAPLQARLAVLQPEPPLHQYHLGLAALDAGEARRAAEYLRRELRRQPENDIVHFALAQALVRLGERDRAMLHLARAVEYSATRAARERYGQQLATLKSETRATRLQ